MAPQLDGSKFAKLTREAGIVGGHVTLTDVDIIFSKVKDRNERKISFLEFRTALKLLAEIKYHVGAVKEECNPEMAEERVLAIVRKLEGPQITAGTTTPEHSKIIDRLMDGPANYISKSPNTETKSWRESLRTEPSTPASRNSSVISTPGRMMPVNPSSLSNEQLSKKEDC